MMTKIRYRSIPKWATLLVFGMLFLRALVPAGFMLAPVDGHLAVVLCEPGVMASGDHHLHHHHPGNDPAAHHGMHGDPSCPYAQSAGSAPLPTLPVLTAGAIPDRLAATPVATQTLLTFGPPRQQTSRGPPSLA
jgi:hypothetical protein